VYKNRFESRTRSYPKTRLSRPVKTNIKLNKHAHDNCLEIMLFYRVARLIARGTFGHPVI
jgi:hypothetical protein